MDKKKVNEYIEYAYDVLKTSNIVADNKLTANYRAQISSFGAAIIMGNVKTAVSYFCKADKKEVVKVIYRTLNKNQCSSNVKGPELFNDLVANKYSKDDVLEAAVAVKLAMNLFENYNQGD